MSSYTRHSADVARIILAAGDGTFTLNGERVIETAGYEVGGYDPDMPTATTNAVRHHHTCGLFDRLAERIFHLRQSPGEHRLGRWTDADGRVHLDATRFVPHPHRDHALEVGALLDQEAIWDWAAGEAINVKENI